MKTKILIIALANAMLSIGISAYAQEPKPSSAENKTSAEQTVADQNAATSDSQNVNLSMTETFQADASQTDSGNIHEQMTIQLQRFLEIRNRDERTCSDSPAECNYDVTETIPTIVY